ncbi:MAG TPA: hypothetical protein VHK01_04845 [Lacipirellulaceae bacterium]|jgi:hypothetical protein|nr:hypothetical protein [Lacipirellulaceae bacterium]
MDQSDQTNKLLTEIRDAIKDGATTRHRDMERLIEQLTKLREAVTGGLERPKRKPEPLIDRPRKPRKTRVRK